MKNKHRCEKSVYDYSVSQSFQCSRNGKYEHEGKWYCSQHYPPHVKERAEKRSQKWNAEWAESEAKHKEQDRLIAQGKAFDELFKLMNAVDPHDYDFDDNMDFDAWADENIDPDYITVSDPGPDSRERKPNDDERQEIIREHWAGLSNFDKWYACFKYRED